MTLPEPARCADINTLEPYVRDRVARILERLRARGFDPVVYEAVRALDRQRWLYGIGRTHDLGRKPVTWTLHSNHLPDTQGKGKAADIISKSRGWNWPAFYAALKEEAARERMHTIPQEQCHIEWQG